MQRRIKIISLGLLVAGLSGCSINQKSLQNNTLSSPYQQPQIIVSSDIAEYTLIEQSNLNKQTITAFEQWLLKEKVSASHKLLISHPASLSKKDIKKIQSSAKKVGMAENNIRHHQHTSEQIVLTLILDKTTVNSCAKFTHNKMTETASGYSENFGCASSKNLAAMVAEPRDLLSGREFKSTSSVRSVSAVQAFNQGRVVELKDTNFEVGGE